MTVIVDLISPIWMSTLDRLSDMVAWCFVLLIVGALYRPKVKYPLLCAILLGGLGSAAQLALDVISQNSFLLFEINFCFWNYMMLALLFYGKKKQKVLHAILFGVAWPQTVYLSGIIIALLPRIQMAIPTRILALGLYLLFLYWTTKNAPSTDIPMSTDYLFSCCIVCLTNVTFLFLWLHSSPYGDVKNFHWTFYILCSGGPLLVEAIVLHMVHLLLYQNERNLTKLIWQRQREESAGLVNRNVAFEEEYQKLQHEISHAASLASLLMEKKEYEEAQNILTELQEDIESRRNSRSSPSIVDAILDEYRQKANTMHVPLSSDVHLTEELPVSPIDLCSMISNMLSNALEASVYCQEPFVSIEIRPVKRYLMIRVKNRVATDVLKTNPNLITTKHNTVAHGKGTRIMRQICKKYNGILNFEVIDLVFNAEALLLL